VPIGFPPLVANMHSAEPLRSTGITPLLHYYGLLRLPNGPCRRYVFRHHVEVITLAQTGLSGSSTDLSARAVPYHPGRPGRHPCSLFIHRQQASPHSGGWPPSLSRNEAETGSLALRLMRLAFGASTMGLLPSAARLPTWRTSKYHGNYLSSCKACQAYPDAPNGRQWTPMDIEERG